MVKILVTGANGFVGSRVAALLEKRGYFVLKSTTDIRNKKAMSELFFKTDIVVHAAGQVKTTSVEEDYYSTNILGTINIAELCMENNTKLIHIGSIETKGAYGVSKRVSEMLVSNYFVPKGLQAIVLRMCVIMEADTDDRKRYNISWCQVDDLAEDIERIVRTHPFNTFELRDYKEIKKP